MGRKPCPFIHNSVHSLWKTLSPELSPTCGKVQRGYRTFIPNFAGNRTGAPFPCSFPPPCELGSIGSTFRIGAAGDFIHRFVHRRSCPQVCPQGVKLIHRVTQVTARLIHRAVSELSTGRPFGNPQVVEKFLVCSMSHQVVIWLDSK